MRILLSVILLFTYQFAFAQKDPKAREVLDGMSKTYQSINAFSADVTQEVIDTQEGLLETLDAKVTIMGDMYVVDIGDQKIYNNNETIWTLYKEFDEVNIDNYDPSAEGAIQTPAAILNMYKEGFKYVYLGETTIEGKQYQMVDLSPENPDDHNFFKLTLYIDGTDGTLKRWEVYEKGNQRKYNYLIKNFDSTLAIGKDYFELSEEELGNYEVVDLR